MADLIFWEGGEAIQDGTYLRSKIDLVGGASGDLFSNAVARTTALGTRCIRSAGTVASSFYVTVNQATAYAEFWFKSGQINLLGPLFGFRDSSNTYHFRIDTSSSGSNVQLIFYNANGTQVGSTYTVGPTNTWVHIGVKIIVGNAGTVVVNIDDNQAYSGSSDFQNASATVSNAFFNCGYSVDYFYFDDIVIQGASGAFLGSNVHCVAQRPSAAGDSTQWTPSTGSNYQNVDETLPDDDSTYNSDSTSGHLDLYATTDLPTFSGNVLGIDVCGVLRKDTGGTETAKLAVKTNSTVYYGSNITLTNSYASYKKQYILNPNTGVAFTTSEANALQIGAQVV
jgi:hypothetical protein